MASPPDETVEASAPGTPTRELAVGTTLGKYRIERVLGSGGMGVVWAAHDPDLDRAIALKVLRYEHAAQDLRTRLLREARAMARLKHPNVLTVYGVDSEGDRDFIAMELVDGASLDAWLATKPPRAQIWQTILAAGQGLAAAHRAGLVHRDFKPHNVLRSHDGRVLVTDFGLARGHGDEPVGERGAVPTGLETTVDASPRASLDEPLTLTGAVIGTPAYMAPEQFLGAASDPRTDQFAYCVTAWQLLAGERPFRGDTIDELRKATSTGAIQLAADMPRAIRTVLARGLEPDPDKRWPDLAALLAALERAEARPRRLRRIAFGVAVAGLGAALAVKLASAPAPSGDNQTCPASPEDEMAKAWRPAMRAEWAPRFDNSTGFNYAANELDNFARSWIDSYRAACAEPRTTKTLAKLSCLLGARDEIANLMELVPTVPAAALADFDMGGALPSTAPCVGNAPVAPPALPDDPGKRVQIKELRKQLIASRYGPPKAMYDEMPKLLAQAVAIGWDPLTAEAHQAFASVADNVEGGWDVARDHYQQANEIARSARHDHLEADTWIGLLGSELQATSNPREDTRFLELLKQAREAARKAGDDPVMQARITYTEGIYAQSRNKLDDAISNFARARAIELAANDIGRATEFSVENGFALLRRNQPNDLAAAWALAGDADGHATAAKRSEKRLDKLRDLQFEIAFIRGDLAAAHVAADRQGRGTPPDGAQPIEGRVVDADGKPVAGATVVAWSGALVGDAARVYTWLAQPIAAHGDVAVTRADGTFTVSGVRGGAIIAEHGDRRSQPHSIGDGALALTLEPTRAIAGDVESDDEVLTGIAVGAFYRLGESSWEVIAPVGRLHAYRLAGIPGGAPGLRLHPRLDPNQPNRKLDFGPVRDQPRLRWPTGPGIDAIVATPEDLKTMIFVLRGHPVAKTRADLDRLVAAATDASTHFGLIVGIADQTTAGMEKYMRGDRHAVFLGNAPGEVTVCMAKKAPDEPARCKTLDLPATRLGVRDGRGVYPTIAVELNR